jgi:alpha-tubulin suppressor-like RCC1 family protein
VTYNLIAASGADGYAVDTTGAVWSWGQGQQAEIGDGARITRRLPVEVVTGGVTMISVTAQDVAVG